jgi:KDO2-lipid IV(A) lauroyltransferase
MNNEQQYVQYIGLKNLKDAEAKGKGVLVLAPHFTHLDATTMFISFVTDLYPVYRPNDNPVLEYVMTSGRTVGNKSDTHIHYHDTRSIIKALRAGHSLGYLPDQRYRGKGHINVPFFGHPAKSHSATSKIAKMTGCAVVPTFTRRIGTRYEIHFLPALENFPSGDDFEDTLRLHKLYEEEIRQNPSQYLWVHNRWDLAPDSEGNYGSP